MESGKPHIFLCDDDKDIVEVTRLILQERYLVHVYYNCDSIIKDVLRIRPAAIILDLWMPSEGGEAIARRLKSNPLTVHIPVILFSASNNLVKVAAALNADAFIAKPYDINELLQVIERSISASAHNTK